MALVLTPAVQALWVGATPDSTVHNQVSVNDSTKYNVDNTVSMVTVNSPEIGWSEASPDEFDPSEGEKVNFNWRLDEGPGYIKIEVYNGHPYSGASLLRTVHDWDYYPTTGYPENTIAWNGKYDGAVVADGTYYYMISTAATYGGTVLDTEIGSFQVESSTTPTVISHAVNPNPFDPDTQSACFDVNLDKSAIYMTVEIKDGSQTVWGPTSVSNLSSGWNYDVKCWNGRNNSGVLVDEKSYTYILEPVNSEGAGSTATGYVTVDYDNGGGDTPPAVLEHDVNPDPFDPDTDNACFDARLDKDGWVTVQIKDGSTTVWGPEEVNSMNQGWNYDFLCWNGEKNNGMDADEKSYSYTMIPENNYGTGATVSGNLTVDYENSGNTAPSVTDHDVNPSTFDPDQEDACFDIELNKDANYATLEIKDGSYTVYGPVNSSDLNDGWNNDVFCWDGDDNDDDPVDEDTYTYYLKATNDYGTSSAVSGDLTVDYDDPAGQSPVIGDRKGDDSDDYADRDPFDPYEYDETTIRFDLNTSATVEFTLSNGSYDIEELTYSANSGVNAVEWDGRKSNNDPYPEGTYYYTIYAYNSYGEDTEHGTVRIDYDEEPSGDRPNITSHFADPEVFDPEDNEDTRIYFRIDEDAYVTLEILDGSRVVRTLLDEIYTNEGSTSRTWDGEDKYGDIVVDDEYEYRIEACDTSDRDNCDVEYGDIEVDTDGSSGYNDDLLSDIEVNNPVFDPSDRETTELCFTVERDNTEVTVEIMDGNRVIDTLLDEAEYDEDYRRCVRWDGEDEDGDEVDDDVYQFRIRAEEDEDVQVEYEYVEVDTDGRIIGFPRDNDYCGGFWDVPKDSPFCKAIELMSYRGVFEGYPDGSFRPYNDINRAEATKVILLALDYDIMSNNGSNLGYWDVITNEWYMPYLRTAQREGVATGYPDGSFRPGSTINRVELLRVFLEATDINVPHCNYSPYADTPLNYDTRWYMDYACFAKTYNLMDVDANGNFNPDQPMSRVDVAELFYRFEKRGLFAGYNRNYYDNYWNTWDSDWRYSSDNRYYNFSY